MPKVIDLPTATSMDDSDYLLMEESSGGTKKITRGNVLSHIGTVVSAQNSQMTMATATSVTLCSVSLPAGTWVIVGQCMVSEGNASGHLSASINNSESLAWTYGRAATLPITTTANVSIHLSRIVTVTTTTTFYLIGYQTSGASKTVDVNTCSLSAVRVA